MSDWHPQIVRVENIVKHPNADALEIVYTSIGDYPIIARLGEWKVGDLCSYIPIDTIVPPTEQFYFLCPQNSEQYEENGEVKRRNTGPKFGWKEVPERYRIIRAKKIRGVYSQGLLVPIPPGTIGVSDDRANCVDLEKTLSIGFVFVGDSVVDAFGLTKWEEEEEDNIPRTNKTKNREQVEKKPDGWDLPYYDKDGLRKYIDCILPDEEIILTEKIHGCCSTFCHDGEKLWVKSRNFFKRGEISFTDGEGAAHTVLATDPWNEIARRLDLNNRLKNYPFLAIFGEVAGQVKGFRYDAHIIDGALCTGLYVFDIFDVKAGRYFDYDDRVALIKELGLCPVPELYRGKWLGKEQMYPFAEGNTTTSGKHIREGFVLNTVKERFEPKLQGRLTLKLIGQGYALQK